MKVIRFRRGDMKVIRFRRLSGDAWEIAFNEAYLRSKLNGDLAEVIMPAKPWFVRLWRKLFLLFGNGESNAPPVVGNDRS